MTRSPILLAALFSVRAALSQTPADQLTVAPGFKVELLKAANPGREGSWVSMTTDDQGRLYISPQGMTPEGGIMRVTLDDPGHIAKTDWLKPKVGASMGMLWAFNSLYVNGQGPDGQGIYRLRPNADGELDKAELFKKIPNGGGEHGSHGMVLGPDGKSIYIVNGNSTPLIDGIDTTSSPYRNYGEDILVPRVMDPVATFFDNIKIPCGHILRTDENGTKWELFAGGMRNAYDIDFNPDGELFTYDSDMEWDVGLPWYRPTRILHLVPGGEYGFREGNQKWPVTYADSLPPVCDIGLGCPTGLKFGTKSNFPAKYKSAFFVLDWTFGRILAIHMQPKGASYTAKSVVANYTYPKGPESGEDVEVFLSGKAMPLTALVFGKDGSMYFTVGGRGTQAALYRVSYTGNDNSEKIASLPRTSVAMVKTTDGTPGYSYEYSASKGFQAKFSDDAKARATQQKYFGEKLVGDSFPDDPLERYHARLALESMDVEQWKSAALSSSEPGALKALLALARVGPKADQALLLSALKNFPIDGLNEEQRLFKLRIIKVSFARQGRPSPEIVQMATEKLMAHYPAHSFVHNREISELLIWLTNPALVTPAPTTAPAPTIYDNAAAPKEATEVIARTLKLLANAPTQEEQIWYACMLREAVGWTPEQRAEYFAWFNQARDFKGGNSLGKFIDRIKEQALAHVPDADRAALAVVLNAKPLPPKPLPPKPQPPAPVRTFQKAWTLADLDPELPRAAKGRDFARGKEIFASVLCLQCHHFAQDGGNVGPDLSAVGNRFSRHDILEAIIDPSKAISEQYAAFLISTKQGETIMGQVAGDDGKMLTILTNPIAGTKQDLAKADILTKTISPVSLMPPGLLNTLTKDEVLDLLAYIESGGHVEAPQFAKER